MRKFALLALLLTLLSVFTLTPLAAQDAPPDIFASAALAPATAEVYMALRIDDAYIANLNDLITLVASAAGEFGLPVDGLPRLQDLIGQRVHPDATSEDIDAILAWAGDTVAISGILNDPTSSKVTFYLPITDKQAALDALNNAGLVLSDEVETVGRFMIYTPENANGTTLLLADDLMILTSEDAQMFGSGDYAKLSDAPAFTAAVSDLPADAYDVAFYMSSALVNNTPDMNEAFQGDILIGGTILDSKTLTIDAVGVPTTPAQPAAVIDPAFSAYLPANSNAVIHAADFANLLNSAIALGEARGNTSARAEFEQVLMAGGLSLDELLSWMTGDYATFIHVDTVPLIRALNEENMEAISTSFDFGVILEATDPALAQKFAGQLTEILTNAITDQPDVALSTVDINGTSVTRIELSLPTGMNNQTVNFALGLAANDEIFVIGTFRAVESILSGTAGLSENPLYAESAAYLLPNATSVWYADGSSLASVGVLGILGVASPVGSAMSSMQHEFSFGRETATTAHAQTIQNDDNEDLALVLRGIDRVSRLVRHVTASSAISENGAYVLRATLTLGE